MTSKKVYILTPCYNASKYIDRLLGSVLNQTYLNIEMTVIDDGSTDNSAKIIKSYIKKFKDKGYKLNYIYQSNQGQSVAINNGLKKVDGDYLVWPDSDDFYADSTAIQQMVEVLDSSDNDTSTVRVQYNVLNEDASKIIYRWGVDDDTRYKTDLFEDYLFNSTSKTWVVPGGYMVKVSKIDELIPGREIYTEKDAGQNFQIMLPLLYNNKCLTIEKYLYNVVEHSDSHSRQSNTFSKRISIYKKTAFNTLKRIPLDNDYRKYLFKKYDNALPSAMDGNKKRARTYVKKSIKAILPYGVVAVYKRRRR